MPRHDDNRIEDDAEYAYQVMQRVIQKRMRVGLRVCLIGLVVLFVLMIIVIALINPG